MKRWLTLWRGIRSYQEGKSNDERKPEAAAREITEQDDVVRSKADHEYAHNDAIESVTEHRNARSIGKMIVKGKGGDNESKGDTRRGKSVGMMQPPNQAKVIEENYRRAVVECNQAKAEWQNAVKKLDWVVEPDQIDFAIYSVIAAEKHYTALLKEVKQLRQNLQAGAAKV